MGDLIDARGGLISRACPCGGIRETERAGCLTWALMRWSRVRADGC